MWDGLSVDERAAIPRHLSRLDPTRLDLVRPLSTTHDQEEHIMVDFRATTTVDAAEGALFDFLSQVGNLPDYFARMTSARPGDAEQVRVPDGNSEIQRIGST